MANILIYPGSSSFYPGNTPFNFYDNDYQFQVDADKVASWCAIRLGYPIMEVELQDKNFYAAFEQAITVYGNELYAYQVRDNLLNIEGLPTSSNLNNATITPTMATIVRLSQQYASEAGVGGNVTYYSGSVALTSSIQDYDLTAWAQNQNITGGIEIKRIFYQPLPAILQTYNFNMLTGMGGVPAASSYGMLGPSGILMYPTSLLVQTAQAVELQNDIALSAYTFELINGKLRIFPVPNQDGGNLWFQYIKLDDRINSAISNTPYSITNVSNAGYQNPVYSQINSIGKQWIYEYTLAICKEMLGYVRGKYQTIQIPGAETTLNQGDLIVAATAEKLALITRLREYLDQTSRQSLLERKAAESDARQKELGQSPLTIFLG